MDLSLNQEQQMIKTMARDFLNIECPKALVEKMEDQWDYSPDLWHKMVDLGWPALTFPVKYGGSGTNYGSAFMLLEEIGRACAPVPFFSSVIMAGTTILEGGTEEQKSSLLPQIIQGKQIWTLALTEAGASYQLSDIKAQADTTDDGFILNGIKLFIPDANIADNFICAARTRRGIGLFILARANPGISFTRMENISSDRLYALNINTVKVPKSNVIGSLNQGQSVLEKVLRKATLAKCAEMVGSAEKVLEMTADYAKKRRQFGHPIGSFQSIQHHCANMLIDVNSSRLMSHYAAWMLDQGLPCTKEVAMAKTWISDAYVRITNLGQQIHGGLGFIKDHEMQRHYRRAQAADLTFGDAKFHRKVIAREMGINR